MTLSKAVKQLDDEIFNKVLGNITNECSRFSDRAFDDCPVCQIRLGLIALREEKEVITAALDAKTPR